MVYRGGIVAQGRYQLTHVEIDGLEVSLTSGKITRGTGAVGWDVSVEGVPRDSFDRLVERPEADAKETELEFTDDQGASHHTHCHLLRRSQTESGLHFSGGTLTFSFEGPIK
jgi:hypothetical protein